MVIGKKIDKLKRWDLGNDQIEETNVYKYLGVYFSRSLKFTYHIETFIKENTQKKINYMTRILGKHDNFNQNSFGDSLWTFYCTRLRRMVPFRNFKFSKH